MHMYVYVTYQEVNYDVKGRVAGTVARQKDGARVGGPWGRV